MIKLAEQIRSLRSKTNLSQEDLAQKLYISRQAVSKWENGEAIPDIDNLVKLAEIFQVSLDKLVLGKEPEKEVVVEKVVETKTPMNSWEFLADYWWIVFPVGGFLYGLFAAVLKVIQMYG